MSQDPSRILASRDDRLDHCTCAHERPSALHRGMWVILRHMCRTWGIRCVFCAENGRWSAMVSTA